MINISSVHLIMFLGIGGGVVINKGSNHNSFIYLLIVLRVWLFLFTLVENKCKTAGRRMAVLFSMLSYAVALALKTKSWLLFYVFFEFRIIPITLIIFIYGYQPEKLHASIFFILYTVAGRLPLLLFIIYNNTSFNLTTSLISLPITLGFIVKTPLFLLHSWLPKAHVEAPVGGSMVLAGVLLKLGTYGLLLFLPAVVNFNNLLIFYFSLSLIGCSVCALICLRQGDMKLLIAYSSVVHIGVVNMGLISGTETGYSCALLMVISHGFCSPFLFAFSSWLYLSSHSRLLVNNARAFPMLGAILFLLLTINIGVPPRLSVWSEVFIVISTLNIMCWSIPALLSLFLLRSIYNLYIYTTSQHTKFSSQIKNLEAASILPVVQVMFCGYASFFCLDIFIL